MKLTVYKDEPLIEMAIINPKMCKNLSIQVEIEQRDEGPVPHFHVYLDNTRNKKNCAYVRIDEADYCTHHKDGKTLNKKQKKEFIDLMKSDSGKFLADNNGNPVRATWYQIAVSIWVETYEDDYSKFNLDSRGIPVMPNYNNL